MQKTLFVSSSFINLYISFFENFAAAFRLAIETAKIAFAPIFDLFSDPSKFINILSISFWLIELLFTNTLEILLFILFTASKTSVDRNSVQLCADGFASGVKFWGD